MVQEGLPWLDIVKIADDLMLRRYGLFWMIVGRVSVSQQAKVSAPVVRNKCGWIGLGRLTSYIK